METGVSSKKADKIARVKTQKRKELNNLYKTLTEDTQNLDMLIMVIAREVERLFPKLKFNIIARVKTEKSFATKVQNALAKCSDSVRKVQDVRIFDIIGLNIIIEHVPDEIITEVFKGSEAYDKDFASNISSLIEERRTIKQDIELCQGKIDNAKHELERLENSRIRKKEEIDRKEKLKIEKQNQILQMQQLLNSVDEQTNKILMTVIEGYKKDLQNYEIDLKNSGRDLEDYNKQIEFCKETISSEEKKMADFKMIYDKQINECNYEMARFLIRRLTVFEGVKKLNLRDIKNRFKIIEKDNGYRSIHNCYERNVKRNGKTVRFICEIQGKTINDYIKANEGRAASYHIDPTPKKGKILKNKKLPDILSVRTEEEKKKFLEQVEQSIPRFRIYRKNISGVSEIYVFSLRECYMFYYHNQLFGNQLLGISKNEPQLLECAQGNLLKDDGKVYRDSGYYEL